MFATHTRQQNAFKALDGQVLKIKALKLRDADPQEVPVELTTSGFWEQISEDLGQGIMHARTSYLTDDEAAIACHWEEGAMLHPHRHPEVDEYIYVIRGSLRDLYTNTRLVPGEQISIEDVLNGDVHEQPYHIPAGTAHFLQALEPDTFFVIKFKRNDNHDYS